MSPNPFLTIHGPRPETWWAVCDLCGKPSAARFRSEADAAAWEHDCHTEVDDDGTVTMTVVVSIDDPPEISWKGTLTSARAREIDQALSDMQSWRYYARSSGNAQTWRDFVAERWEHRRRIATEKAIAEMEHAMAHPYVCAGCKQRCKTVGGLKNHMRACWKVDPFKLKRGEYDHTMVPGGVPDEPGAER